MEQVTYSRLCPTCGTAKFYPSQKRLDIAVKQGKPCKSCHMKRLYAANPTRNKGENNPMYKKGFIEVWRETFDPEEFQRKMAQFRSNLSCRHSGNGNPMYGKPSPKNSGHGISGSWRGCNFRSLLELAFIEWHVEKFGCFPTTAEKRQYRVTLAEGKNYYPDFVRADGVVVEIKPRRLLERNQKKFSAARTHFGDKFLVMTESDFLGRIEERISNFNGLVLNKRKNQSKGFLSLVKRLVA